MARSIGSVARAESFFSKLKTSPPRDREETRPAQFDLELQQPANLDYDTIKSFKENGLRLFLIGYESGNDESLMRIKKGVTTDEMRRFTKDCHKAGVVIHGTFILGLPVEMKETIEQTIQFAQKLDVFSLQVSLAAPHPVAVAELER